MAVSDSFKFYLRLWSWTFLNKFGDSYRSSPTVAEIRLSQKRSDKTSNFGPSNGGFVFAQGRKAWFAKILVFCPQLQSECKAHFFPEYDKSYEGYCQAGFAWVSSCVRVPYSSVFTADKIILASEFCISLYPTWLDIQHPEPKFGFVRYGNPPKKSKTRFFFRSVKSQTLHTMLLSRYHPLASCESRLKTMW